QFVLNVICNYIFFNQHLIGLGLIFIIILTIIVCTFLVSYNRKLKIKSLLVLPYFLWLLIATSLNTYIYLYN
ncbi:MAG: tryptophan-rich sensory protein, partial [Flavobacteriaceae bacterium]|nr:tryptophan-rich sensory protein [Flavobacteriaceae bacterium]